MMNGHERALVIVLRISGSITGLALFTIFLPTSWMTAAHEWLGLGPYPQPSAPLLEYLTRSCSALYVVLGGLKWVASFDVRRHALVIRYVAWASVAFGAAMLGIDLQAHMPWHWTVGEGPFLMGLGLVLAWLQWKAAQSSGSGGGAAASKTQSGGRTERRGGV